MSAKELVQCPYDKTHKVREDRLVVHLNKCQHQHQDMQFVVCPFNFEHHMPIDDYEKHYEICPNRKILSYHNEELGKQIFLTFHSRKYIE